MQLSKQYGFPGRASCGLSSGFARPVSAQIEADSAVPRAAGAPLIARTEPARPCGAGGVCAVLPPAAAQPRLPPRLGFLSLPNVHFFPPPTEANFYSGFQTLMLCRFFPEGVLCLFFFFTELPSPTQEKPNLNSEHECHDLLRSLGSANCSVPNDLFSLRNQKKNFA